MQILPDSGLPKGHPAGKVLVTVVPDELFVTSESAKARVEFTLHPHGSADGWIQVPHKMRGRLAERIIAALAYIIFGRAKFRRA